MFVFLVIDGMQVGKGSPMSRLLAQGTSECACMIPVRLASV